ncbi:MAG: hypothetical protein QW767_02470 [Thermoprotei archaeon]
MVDTADTDAAPIAEHLLKHMTSSTTQEGKVLQNVSSAGVSAKPGSSMSTRASNYLESLGIETTGFSTRTLEPETIQSYELTLASDMAVKGILLFLAPGAQIYTVSEYSLTGSDIPPMEELDDEAYFRVCGELNQMMTRVAKRANRNKTF